MASAVVTNKKPIFTSLIEQEKYARTTIKDSYKTVRINEILPFRVRFTAIGIEGVSPTNVPPIPLQIIGYSNYIL